MAGTRAKQLTRAYSILGQFVGYQLAENKRLTGYVFGLVFLFHANGIGSATQVSVAPIRIDRQRQQVCGLGGPFWPGIRSLVGVVLPWSAGEQLFANEVVVGCCVLERAQKLDHFLDAALSG